jgi:hypothetical protein
MKIWNKTLASLALAALIPMALMAAEGGDAGEGNVTKMKLKDLPEAAQKAIKEQAGSEKIGKVIKEVEDGKTSYEAKIGKKEVEVAEDGSLIAVEEKVDLKSVPEAAKAAIEKDASGKKVKVEKRVAGGKTVYEYTVKGSKEEKAVNEDGSEAKVD